MYTSFISRFFFPLHELAKRHATVGVRRALERSQWWSTEQLLQHQVQRMRAFLTDIGTGGTAVPHYRELYARLGFDPRAVHGLADLQALPLLDKATIRARTEALKRPGARDLARFNTGGSSGEPLIFFIGKERVGHDVAAKWRATRWWGVDIGDPEMVVWGSPIELGSQDHIRAWRDRLLRTELLPAFEMNDAKLDAMVAAIRRRRPRMLFGYPSALSHIARHAARRGQRMDDLGIRVAFVTSERLYDEQRAAIVAAFGCPVANGYGGRDAGFIAHECPQGGMHITSEDIVVEIIGADGRPLPHGQAGEIVVTHLATRDFPFVRYRTGDVGVLDDQACPCGRGLPLLKEIQGRSTDFVVAADGTVMHGLALIYVLRDLPGLSAFKIIQHSVQRTEVQVVPENGTLLPATRERIGTGLRARLGAGVVVDICPVAAIAAEKSGKFRYVVSHVELSEAA